MTPFLFDVDWECDHYPAKVDSFVRCLLRLRSNPELVVDTVREPSHLVMILDVSGSMDEPTKYPYLLEALECMLADIEDGTWLTLILFSTRAHVVCEGISAAEAHANASEIIQRVNTWDGLFGTTYLSGALHLAINAVQSVRGNAVEKGVPQRATNAIGGEDPPAEQLISRIYVLTDGHLHDSDQCCALIPRMSRLDVELNSFGFGQDFDFETMRSMASQCGNGTIKQIRNTGDIRERFRRVVEVTARIVAQNATFEIEYGPGVIPGDFFQHRPVSGIWRAPPLSKGPLTRIDLGLLEAERDYVWAMEARLPSSAEQALQMAELRMKYRQGGEGLEVGWPLVPPVSDGKVRSTPDEYIAQVFAELEGLRDDSPEAQIAAYEARIRLCELEGRDPAHIQALRQVLDALKRGVHKTSIDPGLVQQADVDLNTPFDAPDWGLDSQN